jgi:hypothetical protein
LAFQLERQGWQGWIFCSRSGPSALEMAPCVLLLQVIKAMSSNNDAPSDVLGITLEYVKPVFEDLWRQELALKVKEG